jgi:hypothetical protein
MYKKKVIYAAILVSILAAVIVISISSLYHERLVGMYETNLNATSNKPNHVINLSYVAPHLHNADVELRIVFRPDTDRPLRLDYHLQLRNIGSDSVEIPWILDPIEMVSIVVSSDDEKHVGTLDHYYARRSSIFRFDLPRRIFLPGEMIEEPFPLEYFLELVTHRRDVVGTFSFHAVMQFEERPIESNRIRVTFPR